MIHKTLQSVANDIAELKQAFLSTKTVFKPNEAAEYLGISLSTLYKMTSAGILPFSRPNGKLIYFGKAGLDEWILSNPSKSNQQKESEAATYVATH